MLKHGINKEQTLQMAITNKVCNTIDCCLFRCEQYRYA